MALIEKYKERLVNPNYIGYGYVNLNEDVKNLLIENVYEVSFNSLYASLLINLYNDGILDKFQIEVKKEIIDKVEYFLNNRTLLKYTIEYQNYKVWINSLYNNELRECAGLLINLYGQYMTMYYEDILKENKYNWLYIDTDVMYFTASDDNKLPIIPDLFSDKIMVNYDKVQLIAFQGKKRYVQYKGGEIILKGLRKNRHHDIVSIMKTKIRERRIDEVLNDCA